MNLKRLFIALACFATAASAAAQSDTTRIVVSFSPGGPVDFVARALSEQLSQELGHPVLVENKPGANGAIGAVQVARSEPDGRTLWLTSVGAAAINPGLYQNLPYDMAHDFAPVSLVVDNVELLVVNPVNPAKDAAEFVANARKSATPVAMASSGTGSIPHLAIEQLTDATGVKLLHVPYKGAAPAIADVMGGHVSAFFGDVPGLITHVKSGTVKALGLASGKRHPALPDVKTLEEQGIKGVDTINWYALFAPARTPPAVIAALNKAVHAVLATPAVHDRLLQSGAEPAPSTPEALATLLKRDTDKWGSLIKAKSIKAE
jgi:tripartite-type tricarboxylate transporter receptor subunit TctC